MIAYLEIPVPKSCSECKFNVGSDEYDRCFLTQRIYEIQTSRHPDCPLIIKTTMDDLYREEGKK